MIANIRIKDKMRSAYTPEQWMDVQIEEIKSRRFEGGLELTDWLIRQARYRAPGDYEWLDRGRRRIRPGERWGGEGVTAFFRFEAEVPKNFRGGKVVLCIAPGGEGLLSMNGVPLGGVDIKHDVVFIGDRFRGGEKLKFELEQNAQQMEVAEVEHEFRGATLAVVDVVVEEAYFDFRVAYDVMVSPKAAADVREFLFDRLKTAIGLVDFESASRAVFRKSIAAARRFIEKEIYAPGRYRAEGRLNMVGHSHLDLVYQWPYKEFLRKIGRTHSTALNVMREMPDYLFCQSQMKLYEDLKRLYPDVYKGIRRRVKEGRWEVIGGMYVEPDCNLVSGESMIRQLLFGQRFMREEFGLAPSKVCWLPDVFGNSWIMPQILKKSGLEYFITNKPVIWNDTNEFPHNTFWWEGPDGSRVLGHMPATHFGAGIDADVMLTNWDEYKQKVQCGEAMYNYGYGDGRGGPTREDILYARRAQRVPGMPAAEFTHGETFFDRALAAEKDAPVWRNEIYLETHRGTYTSQAVLKKFNRRCEVLYRDAEAAGVMSELLGGRGASEKLNDGWKLVLKNQFHDILPGSHVTEAREDAKKEYAQAVDTGNDARSKALEFIASKIGCDEPAVAVFNFQTWERTGEVEAEFETSRRKFTVIDADGNDVPFQVLGRSGKKLRVLISARGVPAMGYAVYRLAPGAAESGTPFRINEREAENSFFRLRFDKDGALSGVHDRLNGREVIAAGGRGNRFRMFEDVPGRYAAWDIVPMYRDREFGIPGAGRCEVAESGAVRAAIKQERAFFNSRIEQRVVLHRDLPRIDFETVIDWGERDRLLKVEFPLEINAIRAAYDLSFGYIERPTHENTTWDRAKFEVCGHMWADMSEGDYGVSILNDCKYGHDARGGVMRLTLLKGPRVPDPTADLGRHEFTYSLYPHAGDWRAAETPRRAWELNDPLVAVALTGKGGEQGVENSFVEIDRDHVMMSALKRSEDGESVVIRVYEGQNRRGDVRVKFFRRIARAEECDLMENPVGRAQVSGNELLFGIKPYEIKTFRLYFE